jgi:hypothetical protein
LNVWAAGTGTPALELAFLQWRSIAQDVAHRVGHLWPCKVQSETSHTSASVLCFICPRHRICHSGRSGGNVNIIVFKKIERIQICGTSQGARRCPSGSPVLVPYTDANSVHPARDESVQVPEGGLRGAPLGPPFSLVLCSMSSACLRGALSPNQRRTIA